MQIKTFFLHFITFTDLLAVGLVVPLISAHVTSLGGSHFIVGLMGSFYSGLQLFSGPVIGSFSDIKGRKPVLIATLLCSSVTYLLFGVISSIYVLLLLRVILGIFKHTQTLAKAVVSDVAKHEDQSDVYGKMAAVSGIGIAIGPMIGGHIAEDHPTSGFTISCSITCLLFILNAGIVYFIGTSQKIHRKGSHSHSKHSPNYLEVIADGWNKSIQELKEVQWRKYWDVFLLKALVSFSMGIFYSNYSPLLKNVYNLSPKWIGYTISFQGVIGAFISFFIKYINNMFYKNDTEYTDRNLHCFLLITTTFLLLTFCSTWYLFALLLIPLAVGNAILRIVGLEIIVHKSPSNQRGSLIGASNSVRSISGIVAPAVAGYLGDVFGLQYVLLLSCISSFIGALVAVYYKLSTKVKKISTKKKNT